MNPVAPQASTTPKGTTPASNPTTTPPAVPAATLPLAQAKQQVAARDQALQTERQDIVKQETQKAATSAPAPAPATPAKPASTVGFVKMNPSTKMGQLWLVDPAANKVWKKSELNTVREITAPAFGPGVLVVAGDTKVDNGAIRLVILSKDDGSVLATGADDVSADTPLVVNGNQVLALTKGAGGWVLGNFDTSLKPVAKGTDALAAVTAVVPTPSGILVQSAAGPLALLDSTTLKKISNTGE